MYDILTLCINSPCTDNSLCYTYHTKQVEVLGLSKKLTQPIMNENDTDTCENCDGDGYIEILGDGDNFECDVIGHKDCPECNYE